MPRPYGRIVGALSTGAPEAARPALWLLAFEATATLTDYGFHALLGRSLAPPDFAAFQTINVVVLVLGAAFGVTQPVIARSVAERPAADAGCGAMVRHVLYGNLRLALVLVLIASILGTWLAAWLNIPTPAVLAAVAAMPFLVARPTVTGVLQGQQRFVAFGLVRLVQAVSRLGLGYVAIGLGGGLVSAVVLFPVANALALACGLVLLGPALWRGSASGEAHLGRIWRSSSQALIAIGAYMTMLGADLVWANRHLTPVVAARYAAAVLLRRVLTLVPASVLVMLYPKFVVAVRRGELPDRLLVMAGVLALVPTSLGAVVYVAYGPAIAAWLFGQPHGAENVVGWLGVATIGFIPGAIWLNLFLATRPGPFVWLVGLTALLQIGLLSAFHASAAQLALTFGATGVLLALGGLLLYVGWLRPRLRPSAGSVA